MMPVVYRVTPTHPLPINPGPCLPLAGVSWDGTHLRVPFNAYSVVAGMLQQFGVGIAQAVIIEGAIPPQIEEDAVVVNPRLSAEGRRRMMETQFQREAVRFFRNRGNAASWCAPGCLSGGTRLLVNRGGGARYYTIKELVERFNGAEIPCGRGLGRTRIWDPKIPTHVQSMDAEGIIRLNRVEAAVRSGMKFTCSLRAKHQRGGPTAEIVATADHKFWTPDGWASLGSLKAGVFLGVSVKAGGRANAPKTNYEEILGLWHHPYVVKKRRGRGGLYTLTNPKHRIIAEAQLNGLSLDAFVGRVFLNQLDGLIFLDPVEHHVHHMDGNPHNNDVRNLQVLPAKEHHRLHGDERHVLARREWWKVTDIRANAEKEQTYDLTMAGELPNFVANRFIVHNSGKSTMAIAALSMDTDRTIFITKGGVRRHICSEIRTLTSLTPAMCAGESPTKEDFAEIMESPVAVVGWEILPAWKRFFLQQYKPRKLVADEAHMSASHKRGRSVIQPDGTKKFSRLDNWVTAALDISKRCDARWATTATPLPDGRPRNLYGQLDLTEPGAWGNYWREYAPSHCRLTEGEFGYNDRGSSHLDVLQSRLNNVVYHVPYSVSHRDLPPCRIERFTLSPEEQRKGNAPGLAADIKKARKARNDEHVLQGLLLQTAARKHFYVCETVEEALLHDQKIVVFSGRRADTYKLGEALARVLSRVRTQRLDPAWTGPRGDAEMWVLTGEDSEKRRYDASQEYMKHAGAAVLVATYDSMGVGVDLSDTDLALIVMLPYTPILLEQMIGRFPRLNMKRSCLIRFVVCARSIDERIASILLEKLPTIVAVTGDARGTMLAEVIEGVKGRESEIMQGLAADLAKAPEEWLQ